MKVSLINGLILTVVIICSQSLISQEVENQFVFQNYSLEEGLPQSQISSVYQDNQGYLWLGSFSGISKFDGKRFQTFDTSSGLPINRMTCITGTSEDILYFGTWGGGVIACEKGEFSQLPVDAISGFVIEVFCDSQDNLWVLDSTGVFRFENDTLVPVEGLVLPNRTYSGIVESSDGIFYVSSHDGLFQIKDGTVTHLIVAPVVLDTFPYLNTLCLSGNDQIITGGVEGMFRITIDADDFAKSRIEKLKNLEFVSSAKIINEDLWVGTRSGLYQFTEQGITHLTTEDGLPDNAINRIFFDDENNLWVATEEGISQINPSLFNAVRVEDGLTHKVVSALYEDENQQIWLGGPEGISIYRNGEIIRTFGRQDGLPTGNVITLAGVDSRNIFIADSGGLCKWNGREIQLLSNQFIATYVFADSKDRVFFATNGSMFQYQISTGMIIKYKEWEDIGYVVVICMAEDAEGRIWCATDDGRVLIWGEGKLNDISDTPNFTRQQIWSMALAEDNAMWLASNGEGIFRFKDGEVSRYSTSNGLTNNFVWQLIIDPQGKVWAGTNRGVDVISDNGIRHFSTSDGLLSLEGQARAELLDSRGNIWLGSARGASYRQYTLPQPVKAPLPIHITAMEVNDRPVDSLHGDVLGPGKVRLSLEYIAINYRRSGQIRYQYRLAGLDDKWSETTAETKVTYASLQSGEYTFNLRATYDGGQTWFEQQKPVIFSVSAYFYTEWWFIVLTAVALVAMGFLAYRWNLTQAKARNTKLEAEVKERTSNLENAMADLGLLNIELQEKNQDLEFYNAAVSHDLKAPINRIRSYCELIDDSLDSNVEEARMFVSRIKDDCVKSSALIKQLLDHLSAAKKEIQPETFNAWDCLAEVYMRAGNNELAGKYYLKSLELNPNNTNAKQMLNRMKNGH